MEYGAVSALVSRFTVRASFIAVVVCLPVFAVEVTAGDTGVAAGQPVASAQRIEGVQPSPSGSTEAPRAIWLVDDFEDGNIDGWLPEGNDSCTASTSAVAAHGAYSMRVDGACGHFHGRVFDVTGSTPTGVGVWVRSNTVDTADTYFVLGDADSGSPANYGAAIFYGSPDGLWLATDGTVSVSCGPRNAGQWYYVSFNVDWACKMYDVAVDGVTQQTNLSFHNVGTESFDRIHVYNFTFATSRYDNITFTTPPPSSLIFADDFERMSTCRWSATVE